MNRRQRKKKNKGLGVKIIIGCEGYMKREEYEKLHKAIEHQLKTGSVIILPVGVHAEAVIQEEGGGNIKIKEKKERIVEIPVEYEDGAEEKIYIKAYIEGDFEREKEIAKINIPRLI